MSTDDYSRLEAQVAYEDARKAQRRGKDAEFAARKEARQAKRRALTFAEALKGFIATARRELRLETSDQSLMLLIMDGLRTLSPDEEQDAVDAEVLAGAIEVVEYQMRPMEHQTHG
jgi:hypothetical protein